MAGPAPVPAPAPPPTVGASYANGWAMGRRYWGRLFVVGLIVIVVSAIGNAVQAVVARPNAGTGAAILGGLIAFVWGIAVTSPVEIGALKAYAVAARGETPQFDMVFAPFQRNYLSAVVAPILVGIAVLIGFLILIVPGIYLAVRLSLVTFIVADEGLNVGDALSESWRRTQGHFWTLFGAALLAIPIVVIGALLLIVGLIPAFIWCGLAYASLYNALTRERYGPLPIGA